MADKPINKDMLISDLVEKYPLAAEKLLESGIHCIGCVMARQETIEQGLSAHGIEDEALDKLIDEMNDVVGKDEPKQADNKEEETEEE